MTKLFSPIVALGGLLTCVAALLAGTTQATAQSTQPATQPTTQPESRWESTIAAFEAADRENPPETGGVLFVGSSSIRGWRSAQEDFPNHNVLNRGFGGSTIPDVIDFTHRIVIPYRPRTIVFYAGDNDVSGGHTPEQVLENYQQFVSMVHEALPQTRIIFISIKPSEARWKHQENFTEANRLVRAFSEKDHRLEYLDIVTPMLGEDGRPRPELYIADKLHMTPEGYDVWTETLRPLLEEATMQP